MQYAIETFSLTKIFSDWWGRAKVYAVEDLNLKIQHNEVFGLLGPNGSGKTTTIKMLLGLLNPTKGKALCLGGNSTDPKINSRIGFLPEESYLYKYLTAAETLDFYGRLFGLPSKVRKSRIEALLDMVGLQGVANRPVGTYSKGMARRIGLAQALINDPELLLLDEPTTGLDPIGSKQIKDLIVELVKRGKTILLCSHLLADVEDVCNRIAILYGGKIQSQGHVREMLQQSDKTQITTGHISDNTLSQIRQLIQNESSQCDIASPMDKLETFFVRTVAAAQQQAKATSGAVSTTKISDFLMAQTDEAAKRSAILDKLVSQPVVEQKLQSPAETEKVTPVQAPQVKPDLGLLEELTHQAKSAQVTQTATVKPQAPEPQKTASDILEQLTKPVDSQSLKHNRTDNSSGDLSNA